MICQSDRIRIESLEKELANREKIIDELKRTIDNFPPTVRASEMEKAIKAEIKETDAHYMRCKCLEKCEKMKREKTIKMDRGKYATPSVSVNLFGFLRRRQNDWSRHFCISKF